MDQRGRPHVAALNLQQTLIATTPLILTGLAVAFAFRCGLFNIGGQGQYIVGSIFAVWVGSSFEGMPALLHIVLAMLGGVPRRARSGRAIAGALKAVAGTNEVISTIMLNWIAIWIGVCLFNLGGPLQNTNPTSRTSRSPTTSSEGAKLPVFWGDPVLQGLHIGLFIALAALLVFWVILNRTTLGYEVRAVGFNPDAAARGRHLGRPQLHRRDGDLRRCSPAWPARSTCSAGSSASRPTTSRSARSASSASRSRCSGATRRSACSSRRCCSAR